MTWPAQGVRAGRFRPRQADYGHYLTPAKFRQRFSPKAADLKAVRTWLADQGFSLVYTPANGHYVAAEGTVAEAEAAFGAQLNEYAVRRRDPPAPAAALSVPASLAGVVAGVVGVDESASLVHPYIIRDAPPSPGFRNSPPLSNYWAEFLSGYGYPAGFTAQLGLGALDGEGLHPPPRSRAPTASPATTAPGRPSR